MPDTASGRTPAFRFAPDLSGAAPLRAMVDLQAQAFRDAARIGGETARFWEEAWRANLEAAAALSRCRSGVEALDVLGAHAEAGFRRQAEAASRIASALPSPLAALPASAASKTARAGARFRHVTHATERKAIR